MSLPESFLDPESLERAAADARLAEPVAEKAIDFEIRFFDSVLRRNRDYVDVLRCQGELLSRRGRHAEALEIDRRLASLRPDDAVVRYNLACSLAMEHQSIEAVSELRRAIDCGYDDFAHLESDHDLDGLRSTPAFQALMREIGLGN